jgi:hypothetical protein
MSCEFKHKEMGKEKFVKGSDMRKEKFMKEKSSKELLKW